METKMVPISSVTLGEETIQLPYRIEINAYHAYRGDADAVHEIILKELVLLHQEIEALKVKVSGE